MARRIRVGDTLTLPSGKVVQITLAADSARPWCAHRVGAQWGVRREQPPQQVLRHPWQHYTGQESVPLLLGEGDALALAYALNRVAPATGAPAQGPTPGASDPQLPAKPTKPQRLDIDGDGCAGSRGAAEPDSACEDPWNELWAAATRPTVERADLEAPREVPRTVQDLLMLKSGTHGER